MNAATIRRRFLDFFVGEDHQEVPSSSLVPADDPTLLFTNAGMVQFKRTFLGLEPRDYLRAASAQKCVRAGGKHNDLEQVGHTDRHHTFFEMLGNFSFGDYFKRDAIAFAWEFVTAEQWLGIHPDRIRISIHHRDEEARRLWREVAGIRDERIYGLGDEDNFWQMAETGPCGPCSEIYVDLAGAGARGLEHVSDRIHSLDQFVAEADAGRFLEIWNLVFMQYDRQPDGELVPLPAPSVDTGAGLERIAAVMQGVPSNFETDLFLPLIRKGEDLVGVRYHGTQPDFEEWLKVVRSARDLTDEHLWTKPDVSLRVLADHARAVAFLLADGVYPSNEGRGYVLRRILRRAVRHAWLLGRREPTLVALVGEVVRLMGGTYPELEAQATLVHEVTRAEEERFLATIEGGLERLEAVTGERARGASGTGAVIGADDAFTLYDTFGFPIDLTQLIAAERGFTVDVAGFERLLGAQRERSRRARGAGALGHGGTEQLGAPAVRLPKRGWTRVKPRLRQRWVGYERTRVPTDILAFRHDGGTLALVLRDNPFYAEAGGQVRDAGVVEGQGWRLAVDDVRPVEGGTAVLGRFDGPFEPTPVVAAVDRQARHDTERNHTATHLLHAALRAVLGTHVRQAGSVVAPDRLRFDFTHHQSVGDDVVARIEEEINAQVWENIPVETREMSYRDAIGLGAMALFGEKYGDVVRVVRVADVSMELCGGTHVRTTGEIGLLRLVSETGVAAGVRRVEALTGPGAARWMRDRERLLHGAAEAVGSAPEHLARRVEVLLEERRRLERRVEELIRGGGAALLGPGSVEAGGARIAVATAATDNRQEIGAMIDAFRAGTPSGVAVIVTTGDRPGVHVGVTDDLVARGVRAPELVNAIAAVSGGRGGGRPHFASAGIGDAEKIRDTEREAVEIVRRALAASGLGSAERGVAGPGVHGPR